MYDEPRPLTWECDYRSVFIQLIALEDGSHNSAFRTVRTASLQVGSVATGLPVSMSMAMVCARCEPGRMTVGTGACRFGETWSTCCFEKVSALNNSE